MDQSKGTKDLRPVGFWARLGASILDVIILVLLITATEGFFHNLAFPYASAVINFVVTIGYYLICLSWKRRTIGQWIFRQIVILSNGDQLPPDVAVKRSAYILITYLLLGLPLLTILFSSKKQALHDIMANTVVAKK